MVCVSLHRYTLLKDDNVLLNVKGLRNKSLNSISDRVKKYTIQIGIFNRKCHNIFECLEAIMAALTKPVALAVLHCVDQ